MDSDKSPKEEVDSPDNTLAEGEKRPPSMSVLAALQSYAKSPIGVHIGSGASDDVPVRVTDEAKALRDPGGRYQILGEVGRGGVGVVYKGRDQDLGRDVAMKVLRDDYADHPEILARFVEEAQIGGQLQHPGIVPVYELGLQSGERPYFAMKLVKGETLSAMLAGCARSALDKFSAILPRYRSSSAPAIARSDPQSWSTRKGLGHHCGRQGIPGCLSQEPASSDARHA
jgi:hypothetical protein